MAVASALMPLRRSNSSVADSIAAANGTLRRNSGSFVTSTSTSSAPPLSATSSSEQVSALSPRTLESANSSESLNKALFAVRVTDHEEMLNVFAFIELVKALLVKPTPPKAYVAYTERVAWIMAAAYRLRDMFTKHTDRAWLVAVYSRVRNAGSGGDLVAALTLHPHNDVLYVGSKALNPACFSVATVPELQWAKALLAVKLYLTDTVKDRRTLNEVVPSELEWILQPDNVEARAAYIEAEKKRQEAEKQRQIVHTVLSMKLLDSCQMTAAQQATLAATATSTAVATTSPVRTTTTGSNSKSGSAIQRAVDTSAARSDMTAVQMSPLIPKLPLPKENDTAPPAANKMLSPHRQHAPQSPRPSSLTTAHAPPPLAQHRQRRDTFAAPPSPRVDNEDGSTILLPVSPKHNTQQPPQQYAIVQCVPKTLANPPPAPSINELPPEVVSPRVRAKWDKIRSSPRAKHTRAPGSQADLTKEQQERLIMS